MQIETKFSPGDSVYEIVYTERSDMPCDKCEGKRYLRLRTKTLVQCGGCWGRGTVENYHAQKHVVRRVTLGDVNIFADERGPTRIRYDISGREREKFADETELFATQQEADAEVALRHAQEIAERARLTPSEEAADAEALVEEDEPLDTNAVTSVDVRLYAWRRDTDDYARQDVVRLLTTEHTFAAFDVLSVTNAKPEGEL